MKLKELIQGIEVLDTKGDMDVEIEDISHGGLQGKNLLHVCYRGVNEDGHKYYKQAIDSGAVALVVERYLDVDVPQVLVRDGRVALAILCKNFFNNPIHNIKVIGITGTNGKTSTSLILGQILNHNSIKAGVIGTNGYFVNGRRYPTCLTTPDPYELWKIFAFMNQSDVKVIIMEVSAHAIALHKIDGIDFAFGAFTNLTLDHLDFFLDMNNYANTKKYFIQSCERALINTDDSIASTWNKFIDNSICYGRGNVDFKILDYATSIKGSVVKIKWGREYVFRTSLIGEFNVYNLTCAIALAFLLGCRYREISEGVKRVYIDGRFNILPVKGNVIVDYAHTPDGMENVLITARRICHGRIITVFGCGGNRDKSKRPIMGGIASKYSDYVIVTSDNPRYENPLSIIKSIEEGIINRDCYKVIEDRASAIREALTMARSKDLVLILGKGAEDYQDIKGQKIHFSDSEEVISFYKG